MSISRERGPVWGRTEPGGRRPRFTREQIAQTALALADREGFEAISMRRIAEELGAGTMSLYHYVETKDELVAVMDDALMGESLVNPKELARGWRHGLATIARSTRAALLRHPWALFALQQAHFGPNAIRHFEQSLAAVSDLRLDGTAKVELAAMVDAYVFGSVLRAAELRTRIRDAKANPDAADAGIDFVLGLIRSGGFPHIAATFGDADPRTARKRPKLRGMWTEAGLDEHFEEGLQTLLDGMALRLGAASRSKNRGTRARPKR
jgi:AcrR family transcriptional regulator